MLTVMMTACTHRVASPDLPPGAFTPAPKVHSTVVRLELRRQPIRLSDERLFERLVKTMFSSGGRPWPMR